MCLASLLSGGLLFSQSKPKEPPASANTSADRSAAYYNFAMGHLYAELAGAYGNRGDYFNKAIDYYKQAMKLDPSAKFLSEELTDLYIQAGRLKDAVTEAQEMLKQDPDNLDARRLLGRIYARLIGDAQQNKINEDMLRSAIDQFQRITAKDPKDIESWLMLGRLEKVARNSVEAEKAYKKVLDQESDNEEALTGLAMVYSDLGDTKNAIEMLRRATDKNPNIRTLAALAQFYEQTRDYANAADVWRRAMAMTSDNMRIKRALAQDLLFTDKLDESLKLYDEVAAEDPRDAQIQLRISEIYRAKRDFPKARAAFVKAKELDKDNLEVRYDEVNLLEAEGKTDEAISTLKTILDDMVKKTYTDSEKSSRTMLLERLGVLYRNANRYPEAVEAFRQIAAVDPEAGARATVQVIDTWRQAKDFARARQEAELALKKYPKDRMLKLVHASVLADMGKTDQAVAELSMMLRGDKDRETQLAIAQIYEKSKRYAEMAKALDAAEKLSESKQDKATVYFMRGAMLEKMKKFDAAEAEFRKVLAEDPENAGALNYLGYMLADRNVRLDEAEKMVGKAVELDPQNGAYLDSLGWVYYRQDKLVQAETYLRRALERIGKDPTVHDHLGDVYFKEGKVREAIAQWQASLKEWDSSPQSELDPSEVAKITKKLESARVRVAQESNPSVKQR